MSETKQPVWKLIANLGDVHPLEYGGYFVYVDETGVYPPEAELLEVPEDENGRYIIRRFVLGPCTYINGILSDNPFHPTLPAWFAKPESERAERPQDNTYLKNIADSCDMTVDDFAALFCSDNPLERAEAWRMVGEYHGFDNLDSYPLELSRQDARLRIEAKR